MRAIYLLLLISALLAATAHAETSSWTSQGDAASPAGKKAPAATKAQKPGAAKAANPAPSSAGTPVSEPGAATSGSPAPSSAGAPVSDGVSSHAKAPPKGDVAAYEAFDQGRYLTALELAVKAAETGDPQAHTLVGRIYSEGYGVAKNSALAAKWYFRGAELGDPEAMFAYGMMLVVGQGVGKDTIAAARYVEAAGVTGTALAE